jgi:hypothetical protein
VVRAGAVAVLVLAVLALLFLVGVAIGLVMVGADDDPADEPGTTMTTAPTSVGSDAGPFAPTTTPGDDPSGEVPPQSVPDRTQTTTTKPSTSEDDEAGGGATAEEGRIWPGATATTGPR